MKGKKVLLVHPITVKGILYKEVAEMAGEVVLQIQVGEEVVARSTPSRITKTTSSAKTTTTTWEVGNGLIHLRRRKKRSNQRCTTVEAQPVLNKTRYRHRNRSASCEAYHLNNKSGRRTTWCNRIGQCLPDPLMIWLRLSAQHACRWLRLGVWKGCSWTHQLIRTTKLIIKVGKR